jgi:hypothetical protein
MTAQLLRLLLAASSALLWLHARADEPPGPVIAEAVPLPDNEVRQITVSLLQRYPELAASPGVKVAGANLGPDSTDSATVIYQPHSERRGIKEAFQVHCGRTHPSTEWTCDELAIRRYLQLPSQDFEVRVLADISSESAFALIEGSRRDLHASPTDVSGQLATAIIVTPHHDEPGQYFVGWGTPEGFLKLTMLAKLTDNGDSANPDDWRASIFEPSPQE